MYETILSYIWKRNVSQKSFIGRLDEKSENYLNQVVKSATSSFEVRKSLTWFWLSS